MPSGDITSNNVDHKVIQNLWSLSILHNFRPGRHGVGIEVGKKEKKKKKVAEETPPCSKTLPRVNGDA